MNNTFGSYCFSVHIQHTYVHLKFQNYTYTLCQRKIFFTGQLCTDEECYVHPDFQNYTFTLGYGFFSPFSAMNKLYPNYMNFFIDYSCLFHHIQSTHNFDLIKINHLGSVYFCSSRFSDLHFYTLFRRKKIFHWSALH